MKKTRAKRPAGSGHRYLLYARVSPKGSQWSATETSIRVQLYECEQYVRRLDPLAECRCVSDEFRSGKDLNRPGISGVLDEIDSGCPAFDTLVVWQLDRLSRNLADAAPLFERLRDAGLGFVSVRQPYLSATGAMARFNLTQTIAIAQLEREMTSERISTKMHWIAKQGMLPYGHPPLGYRRSKTVKNTVEVVPEDAALVREIFARYIRCAADHDFSAMTQLWQANRDKIRDSKQFYRILRNRFYVGDMPYGGEIYKGLQEPLVPREVFDRVQALLPGDEYNVSAPRPSRQKYAYLLSGLVRCRCNPARFMRPASVKKKNSRFFYYKCTDSGCGEEINAEKLDAAVLDLVKSLALDPEYVKGCYAAFAAENAERQSDEEKRLVDVQASIAAAKAEIEKIDQMFLAGVVNAGNADYWNDKLSAARSRLSSLQDEEVGLQSIIADLRSSQQMDAVLASVANWATLLEKAGDNVELKHDLVMSTVARVRCIEHGNFEVDLCLDSGTKKLGIAPDEVMPKGGIWWT